MNALVIGIKGSVIALDRSGGETLWSTHLKGSQFVTVAVEDGAIYAGTSGRLYCLDPGTGSVRWTNELPGMGYGLICIAGGDSSSVFGEHKRRQDASHTSAGA
jgi:outer membrane protein assembly factor BamB